MGCSVMVKLAGECHYTPPKYDEKSEDEIIFYEHKVVISQSNFIPKGKNLFTMIKFLEKIGVGKVEVSNTTMNEGVMDWHRVSHLKF